MNKEIEELLRSAKPEVVKKETKRREKKEQEIKNLYKKALNTSSRMNIDIAKEIIDEYLERRDDIVRWSYLGLGSVKNMGAINIHLYSITPLNNNYSYRIIEDMAKCDQKALNILKRFNTSTPTQFTKDFQGKALLWNSEKTAKLAFLNTKVFNEQGIIFQYPYYNESSNHLSIATDYDTIEEFTYNALENKLGNGIVLSEENIKEYKSELKKLSEKEKAISAFRALSEKNANIIALDICKQLLNNYKKVPNLQPHNYLHAITKCYHVNNNNIKNDADLSANDKAIIQKYLQCYPYSTSQPTLIALPHQNEKKEKCLLMQDIDLQHILESIDIKAIMQDNNILRADIQVSYLEHHINHASDEEKESGNTK